MDNLFNDVLWELGLDNPATQKSIAKSITGDYSIPTRQVSALTGKLEDLATRATEIEDPSARERAVHDIQTASALSVEDLALRLNILSTALQEQEKKGKTLSPEERTLRDFDITALAYTLRFINYPKEAYSSYNSLEEFNKAKEEHFKK